MFDEAAGCMGQNMADQREFHALSLSGENAVDSPALGCFALTINQLKGKVGVLFITHGMPKTLQVDEIVRIGQGSLSAVQGQAGVVPADSS